MSSFAGIETALRALRARQLQLETAAHNVANADTPGYHRQSVDLIASAPHPAPGFSEIEPGQVGTGVLVKRLRRVADEFLAHRIRLEIARQGKIDTRHEATARIETIFDELSDHGISALLGRFWNSWQELANDPTDPGLRTNLVTQSQALADAIQRAARQLQDLRHDLDAQVQIQVDSLNSLSTQVAAINRQIANVEGAGQQANDLRDQRDLLVGEMAKLARVQVTELANGEVRVSLNGTPLVDGNRATTLTTTPNADGWLEIVAPNGTVLEPHGGSLAGLLEQRDTEIPNRLAALDAWVQRLQRAVNAAHAGLDQTTLTPVVDVYDLATPGTPVQRDFFTGTSAADFAVNPAILANPNLIAASQTPDGVGDGSNALAIAALQNDATAGGVPAGGTTIDGEYQALVTDIGSSARAAKDEAVSQQVLVDHLKRREAELSGVSLDEEAALLVSYQRAYQAAARALTAFDEMLDRLINGTGLVGR